MVTHQCSTPLLKQDRAESCPSHHYDETTGVFWGVPLSAPPGNTLDGCTELRCSIEEVWRVLSAYAAPSHYLAEAHTALGKALGLALVAIRVSTKSR